jgi:succinate-semialdehyde dehydrogenase/glutarate-semialdehyde dehydrogenase
MKNSNSKIASTNPATREIIDRVTITSQTEVNNLAERASQAFPSWRDKGYEKRARIIKNAQQLLLEKSETFARLITQEMGRPYVESLTIEIPGTVDLMGYYAKRAEEFLNTQSLPLHNLFFKRRKSTIHIEPLGLLGIISPWNWPLLIPVGCLVPALLAGNAVLFKPSEITPLLSIKIRELFLEAGVPEDILQIVQGYAPAGRALVDSSVEKVFFTGSTEVGQKIMTHASNSLKKVVLEMGGSDPAIVCADANLDNCSSGILWGGFNNCGQNCNSIERVYVNKHVYDRFINALLEKLDQLHIGNGMDVNTDIGPLATEMQLAKMVSIVKKAEEQGGRILAGGNVLNVERGYFFEPTVILWDRSLPPPSDEEIFGPVIYTTPVVDDHEAIFLANRSSFGLSSSVWTSSLKRGELIAQRIESGSVMVNDSVVSFGIAEASWTGIKKSGIGWVHGKKGMDEMVNFKYIYGDPQFRQQKFWWFPYSNKMIIAMKKGMIFLFGKSLRKKICALPQTLKHFFSYLVFNRKRNDKL